MSHSNESTIKPMEVGSSEELKSEELSIVEQQLKKYTRLKYKNIRDNMRIIDLNVREMVEMLKKNGEKCMQIDKAEDKHSDLLPGIYEGGCKIWECTYDMINFIEREEMNFQSKRVLDLGCGAGLIGILCLIRGATCYFQDYNDEVLKYVTFPNFKANIQNISENSLKSCKFFSGDWNKFLNLWQTKYSNEAKFDYIFTSETIYNPDDYVKLLAIFENLLSPQGTVYLAAKGYYFGPGGGLFTFSDAMRIGDKFRYKTVWKYSNGLIREILEIKFK